MTGIIKKQTKNYLVAGVLVSLSFIPNSFADLGRIAGTWTGVRNVVSPESRPLISGIDAEGKDVYVCRALFQEALLPGKVIFDGTRSKCLVSPFANPTAFEVLRDDPSLHWMVVNSERLPSNTVRTGFAPGGETLYSCRAFHENGLYVGKVARERVGDKDTYPCQVLYGFSLQKKAAYEILVQDED